MPRICVFTGANPGARLDYASAAKELGRELTTRGYELVYGGAKVGLMGIVADAVLAGGGAVTGIIPRALVGREVAHRGLSELRVVDSMHERKAMMADLADGFIAMPGGLGTLEELFEVLTWAQLGIHCKPCGILNVASYFDPLLEFLAHAVHECFVRTEHRAMLMAEPTAGPLLERFDSYQAPTVPTWLDRNSR